MANTFTQIYIHPIFAVQGRGSLIHHRIREDVYRYITGIVRQRRHTMIAINGMPDHLHLLLGVRPDAALSDLVRDIKSFSSGYINDNHLIRGRFQWQQGYGTFSYSRSQLSSVARYIERQEEHHRRRTFQEEYRELLDRFEVEYNPGFLFVDVRDEQGRS